MCPDPWRGPRRSADVEGPLWAPWRMQYVEGAGEPGRCIFCEPPEPVSDRERLVLYRAEHVFVLLNRYPYAPGHLMVAPYAHIARLHELDAATQRDLVARIGDSERILRERYRCDGLNIGANLGRAGGAGFEEHIHFHLVPRWEGDHNFMTVLGEIRVIPTHLETIYAELAERFRELS